MNPVAIKFVTDYKTYSQSGKVVRYENTLGFHFINTGADLVYINQFPLYPSAVLDTMIAGSQDLTTYQIRFDGSVNPELGVITFNAVQ